MCVKIFHIEGLLGHFLEIVPRCISIIFIHQPSSQDFSIFSLLDHLSYILPQIFE